MIHIKTLKVVLAQPWYDMVDGGYKKEEYREIKPYWDSRFIGKKYDEVEFINGYNPDAKRMCFKINAIKRATGKPEWGGDPDYYTWVIYLGERLW